MIEPLTEDEANHCIMLKQEVMQATGSKAKLLAVRRKLRNRLHRIRQGRTEFDLGLKKLIEAQFAPNMSWATFTFSWDISPKDPLEVVNTFQWEAHGGKYENRQVMCDDGIVRSQMFCEPTAFTQQEL